MNHGQDLHHFLLCIDFRLLSGGNLRVAYLIIVQKLDLEVFLITYIVYMSSEAVTSERLILTRPMLEKDLRRTFLHAQCV
jgi:hypothetical protein